MPSRSSSETSTFQTRSHMTPGSTVDADDDCGPESMTGRLPRVDRLLAHSVTLGHHRHRVPIRLPQDRYDMLFRESRLLHPAPSCRPVSQLIGGTKTQEQVRPAASLSGS